MPIRFPARVAAVALLLAGLPSACADTGVEGKYYNAGTGGFAMELRGGHVLQAQGLEGSDLTYEVRGDSVIVRNPKAGPDGMLVLTREKDGTLSAGLLGSLTKR